ncbi:MAG: hypothetical protein WBD64_02335 [Candidatus Zixiibacteriota bacterium]
MRHAKLILAILAIAFVVQTIYAQQKPEVGYLDAWDVPTENQQELLDNGGWLIVDTLNNEITVGGKDYGDCPFWCICRPDPTCNRVGDECIFCTADPDDVAKKGFMKGFINAIVDTLIAKIAEK